MKVIDKLRLAEQTGQPFWSFEYFPPKTEQGRKKLLQCWETMALVEPEFIAT
ncbi:hypothetical protein HMI56_000126 [Coelomomyces lativittatus]|nr:hypothetical protein HMI56_000126 [Coelomomyces lativittatus]